MAVTIQTRRDNAADWTTANPVLAIGEIGIETDTDKAKYGDGFTPWNSLAYWIDPSTAVVAAANVTYDNTNSGLTATDAQAAIDENNVTIGSNATAIANNASAITDNADNIAINAVAIDANTAAIAVVPYKNLLINGDFTVAQRGTTSGLAGYQTVDRWTYDLADGSGQNQEQIELPNTSGVLPSNPEYAVRLSGEIGSTATVAALRQSIEGVDTASGQTITISGYVKGSTGGTAGVRLQQFYGATFGSIDTVAGNITVTTGWTKFEVTVAVPDLQAESIEDRNALRVIIDKILGADFDATIPYDTRPLVPGTMDLTLVQVEINNVATQYEQTGKADQLARCQRYYWHGSGPGVGGAYQYGATGNDAMFATGGLFPSKMRATPTVAIVTAPSYENCTDSSVGGQADGWYHRVLVSTTGRYRAVSGIYSADAEI